MRPTRLCLLAALAGALLQPSSPALAGEDACADVSPSGDIARCGTSEGDVGGGDRSGLREYGFRVGYGYSTRADVQVIPLWVHAGWLLPEAIDAPLARRGLDLEYTVEGWIGGVTGPQNAIEVGVNPIGFKLSYDVGQTIVPYFAGSLGVLYTGLQGIELGGPFEFNENVGVGIEAFVERGLALTVAFRYRHVSNAGIKDNNAGLDTLFGTIGLSWYPRR